MKKTFLIIISIILILVVTYFLGPQPENITEDAKVTFTNISIELLEERIQKLENKLPVKPENEAEIVWIDSSKTKAPCAIVYLHGFSASKAEGEPTHREVARYFGCNLYLSRLQSHGLIQDEPMLDLTADGLIQSAKDAIDIGNSLGEKVIVMGTSTGGTLALYLASANPEIDALILYSPNIEVFDPRAGMLNDPWGLQIARLINGSKYHEWEVEGERKKYWHSKYRYEALTQLQELLEETMIEETFQKVKQPVFMGYYYKNEEEQDKTVSVATMLEMYEQLGTPASLKVKKAFPGAGHHVIGSEYTNDEWQRVKMGTIQFLKDVVTRDSINLVPGE